MFKKIIACAAAAALLSGTFLLAFQEEPASKAKPAPQVKPAPVQKAATAKEAAGDELEYKTTKSGLKYAVLVQGKEGPRPDPAAKVTVHYKGMLEDGTVFDSSLKRGRPAEMELNRVVRGWSEGLQLMTAGSKYKFIIPPELGYGERGMPPLIPGNANLVFEIELISFEPGPKLPEFHKGDPEAQKKTESGLIWEVIKPGTGEPPTAEETAKIKYAIWSQDGTIRTCSEMAGGAFPMKIGQTSFGIFNEGLALIKEGGRCRFIVPPELAFGEKGMGAAVAPNETTIWEIEIVRVLRPLPVPEFKAPAEDKLVTTDSGLKYEVIKKGEGKTPKMDKNVTVHYAGWLEDGTPFDNSYERGDPTTFKLGRVIQGWNEGLQLMQEGAIYKFVIPPELGYGAGGSPPKIPGNSTLIFYVELFEAEE